MKKSSLLRHITGMVILVFALSYFSTLAQAETTNEAFASALKNYYAGNYARAAEELERLLALPLPNAEVHYNLGCAYERLNKPGLAIYHLEKALKLNPGLDDARFNLETVRAKQAAQIQDELKGLDSEPFLTRFAATLSLGSWTIIFLILWWAVVAIWLIARYLPSGPARSGLIAGNVFLGLLTLGSAALLASRIYLAEAVTQAVILPDQVTVREGPDALAKETFKLHAGLKLRLQSYENGWVRVRLANGLEGWVNELDVGAL